VRANVSLPFVRTSADCSVDSFFTLDGSFVVELHNFTIDLELNIRRNETSGRNIFEVPYCETTHSDVVILLEEDSLLNIIQGTLRSTMSDAVKTQICETILDAVKFVDSQELQIQRLKEPAATSSPLPKSDDEAASPGSWSANLDLVYPPRFSDEDVVFGVDGGLLFNGAPADNVEHPPALNTSVLNTK
ncbi:hypothetical protein OSTOST_08392, partial [Ostertagia ostertagi]